MCDSLIHQALDFNRTMSILPHTWLILLQCDINFSAGKCSCCSLWLYLEDLNISNGPNMRIYFLHLHLLGIAADNPVQFGWTHTQQNTGNNLSTLIATSLRLLKDVKLFYFLPYENHHTQLILSMYWHYSLSCQPRMHWYYIKWCHF